MLLVYAQERAVSPVWPLEMRLIPTEQAVFDVAPPPRDSLALIAPVLVAKCSLRRLWVGDMRMRRVAPLVVQVCIVSSTLFILSTTTIRF